MKLLSKLTSLFKKKPVEVPLPQKTEKELEFELIKRKYKLEYSEALNKYFVRYLFNGDWYYLRRWEYDFGLEETRGRGILVQGDDENLNQLIKEHQEWIKEGHVFLPYR